jgi:hypothetical protein
VLDGGCLDQRLLRFLNGHTPGNELGRKAAGNVNHLPGTVRPERSGKSQFAH